MTEKYIPWQDRREPIPPTTQSERAVKSMQPMGHANRAQRRRNARDIVHSPNYHQKTRGKARTRDIVGARCRCADAARKGQIVKAVAA